MNMIKNILLLSTIYPLPSNDNQGTKVCHFFAREWVKMGYRVKSIHIQAVYPFFFYKPIPHGAFSKKSVKQAFQQIISNNLDDKFVPDIIIGHFPNPQLQLVSELKRYYSGSKACEILHLPEEINQLKKVYGDQLPQLMKDIDVWGFRFKYLNKLFVDSFQITPPSFICYSGVPDSYISNNNMHVLEGPLEKFLFVGEMIQRKFPEAIIQALIQVYPKKNFHIDYVGGGHLIKKIEKIIKEKSIEDCITINGKIPRDEILEKYDAADCFIMISKGEAYGLVYLEAMARGCITIASKNEGFDGVIIDGENGFLCEAGNITELAEIVNRINRLPVAERQRISNNAIHTAKCLTDHLVAKRYLNDVLSEL